MVNLCLICSSYFIIFRNIQTNTYLLHDSKVSYHQGHNFVQHIALIWLKSTSIQSILKTENLTAAQRFLNQLGTGPGA